MDAKTALKAHRMKKRQEDVENKERLIAQVRSHACIWDRRLHEHRNRLLIDEAWETIAKEMSMTRTYDKSISTTFNTSLLKSFLLCLYA